MNILFQIPDKGDNIRYGLINIFKINKKINFYCDDFGTISNTKHKIEEFNINVIMYTNDEPFIDKLKEQFSNILFCRFHHGLIPQYVIPNVNKNLNYCWFDYSSLNRVNSKNILPIQSLSSIDYMNYLKNSNSLKRENFIPNNNKNILLIGSQVHFNYFDKFLKNILYSCYKNNYNLIYVIHRRKRNSLEKRLHSNIKFIFDKDSDEEYKNFIMNNFRIGSNKYLYEYITLSDLILCNTCTSTSVESVALNKNILFFINTDDVKELSKDPKLCSVDQWNSSSETKYEFFMINYFNFKVISLNDFNDKDKINEYIVKYMNKEISSYSNTERDNILNYYFKNTEFSENTASNKIISDIEKLLENK